MAADAVNADGASEMPRGVRAFWRHELVVVAIEYLALIILATYPAIFQMQSQVIGDTHSDVWKHFWGLWWFNEALLTEHQLPLFTSVINYPQGGYLYFADPVTALASVPLQPVLGLVCTYNVLIMLQLLGGCIGGYLLAREIGIGPSGSFLAGTVYALSPYVLSYSVASGVTETINLAWPPLFVVYLLKSLRGEGLRAQMWAAFYLFMTGFACWYYSEFMLLMTALTCVFAPVAQTSAARALTMQGFKARLRLVAPILATSFCLILPFASAFALTIKNPYNIVMPEGATDRTAETRREYMGESQLNYTGVLDFWRTGKQNATSTESMDRLTRVYYVSWIVTGLVLVGLWLTPRPWSRVTVFWVCITGAFMFLTLGPDIHIYSTGDPKDIKCVSWPYLFVYYTFPLFKQIAQPFRMMLLVYMGLGILAGMALQRLATRVPRLAPGLWLLPVLVLVETLYVSPTPYPMPMSSAEPPGFYRILAKMPGKGAVYDVPGEIPGSILQPGIYYYYQTFHGRPIPYRTSGETSPQVKINMVHQVLSDLIKGNYDDARARPMLAHGIAELKQMRVQYLVAHRRFLGVRECEILTQAVIAAFAPPIYQDGEIVVWRLYSDREASSSAEAPELKPEPMLPPPPAEPSGGH